MGYVHVAHDCIIGNNVIFANLVTLGGHVEVNEWASIGGGVVIHQFCKVGSHGFVGGGYRIVQDVPPFIRAAKDPERSTIKKFYRYYFRSELTRTEALEKAEHEFSSDPYIKKILEFIYSSERGII